MNRDDLPLGYIVPIAIAIILVTGGLYGIAGEVGLQIASIVISGFLTLALVVLYYQQYSVQSKQTDIMDDQQAVQEKQTDIMEQQQTINEKQTKLMERDYESSVAQIGQITAEGDYIYLSLNNAGRGIVQKIYLRSEIVSDMGSIDIEPGKSQVTTVEGNDSTLPGVSPPKDFKAEVQFIKPRESGEEGLFLFKYFTTLLAQEEISKCTICLTLEIFDENTRAEDDIIEREIANQELTIPELVTEEVQPGIETPQETQFEDAIELRLRQDILPHDFEERTAC